MRALTADNPAAHQARLARAPEKLSTSLGQVGRYREALEATQEAVTIWRPLTAGNPAHQAGLSGALSNLGVFLDREGRSAEALAACTEAAQIYRDLARTDPGLYEDRYHRLLTFLQENLSGMQYEALTHNLADQS